MKVLQLCLRVPFPPRDGATIAMFNLSDSLIKVGAIVKALSFNTKKSFINPNVIDAAYSNAVNLETINLDATVKSLAAFLNFFKPEESYNIKRFYSLPFENRLVALLKESEFDIIHLEGLYLAPYVEAVRKHSKAKIVLRAHNVEYIIWQRLSEAANNPIKKFYLSFLSKRLKEYETSMLNKYDAIVPLTSDDEALLKKDGCSLPMFLLPIGVDTKKYSATNSNKEFSLFHLGSMDWMPNIEAVDWFLTNVWHQLKKELPEIKLHLAGSSMPERIKKLADKNLFVYDRIADAQKFMSDKPVMIVPLLSGGGMRVKIIEGLASGKIIISTSIGAEGIGYTNNVNILIANDPNEFISAIKKLYDNTAIQKSISKNARMLAEKSFDNEVLGKRLFDFYQKIISTKNDLY
jgi:polysaccharide biosynthesis protein PslH